MILASATITAAPLTAQDPCDWPTANSTATASVSVLDCAFEIPELGRVRRVWIYLPRDYDEGDVRYPVLYMHDGQNVFDAATSYAGEWGLDEALDSLAATRVSRAGAGGSPGAAGADAASGIRAAIVVAVDNGRERRLDEYSPWRNDTLDSGGEGAAYAAFLANTLKPYIDARFRTLPGRGTTGIAGSSMGGLISLYAALEHPDVFGRVGVFSPAFWFAGDAPFDHVRQRAPLRPGTRVYMVTGGREGDDPATYVRDHERMAALLREVAGPGVAIEVLFRPAGTHSEGFWRAEFPQAYRWLFAP